MRYLAAGLVHFCYANAAQPAEQGDEQSNPDFPDISDLSPHLQLEWHPDNDALLGGIKVTPHSNRKVL